MKSVCCKCIWAEHHGVDTLTYYFGVVKDWSVGLCGAPVAITVCTTIDEWAFDLAEGRWYELQLDDTGHPCTSKEVPDPFVVAKEQSDQMAPGWMFGLHIGRLMYRFGILSLVVRANDGTEIGKLVLASATSSGVTLTAVGWDCIDQDDILQTIHDLDGHDLPPGEVYGSWDNDGLKRLDACRREIVQSWYNAVWDAEDRKAGNVEDAQGDSNSAPLF